MLENKNKNKIERAINTILMQTYTNISNDSKIKKENRQKKKEK